MRCAATAGATPAGKKPPTLFVLDCGSGSVQAVGGLPEDASCGQPVWSPAGAAVVPAPLCTATLLNGMREWLPRRRARHPPRAAGDALIFVSWEHQSERASARFPQRLGVVYCFNRPCSLQVVPWPQQQAEAPTAAAAVCITRQLSSAFSPRFSPDGSTLVVLSQQKAVASGVHNATTTLHSLRWAHAQAALGGGMAPPPRTGALPAPGRNAAGLAVHLPQD